MRRLLLLTLFLLACGDGPTRPELVDDACRLRVRAPDSTWMVLNEEDARRLLPDATLAMTSRDVWVAAIIAKVPGISLDEYAAMLVSQTRFEDQKVEHERTFWTWFPAVRFSVS